jgi:redox-sensitive bicupin YhaK (pirin superfamily)
VNGSIQELLERSPFLEGLDRRDLVELPQLGVGEGLPVRRAFAGVDLAALDPFVHMDQMGEVNYARGEPKGTPWHPHRGFETVTYMIDGILRHQDSNGGGGLITDGDTQWMTAGRGLIHIEAPPEEVVVRGGLFHGFQLWVNLPARLKMTPPRYQDIRACGDPAELAGWRRAAAGDRRRGRRPPGPGDHLHPDLAAARHSGSRRPAAPAWRADFNAVVYVLAGSGSVGVERRPVHMGQLAVYGPGEVVTVAADTGQERRSPQLDVLVLGGQPIREPVAAYGPFVMNTRAELIQAFEDYQAGRLGSIPAEPHPGHGVLRDATSESR